MESTKVMTYEEAQAAVHANPDDADAWFVLGGLEEEAGHAAQAIVSYRRAVVLDPFMKEALDALTNLQGERVLTDARSSLARGGIEEKSPITPPLTLRSVGSALSTRARWLLLALVLLFLGLAAFLYLNFGLPAVTPSDPAAGGLGTVTSAPTDASPVPASPTATLQPTSTVPVPTVTSPPLTPTVVSAAVLLERVAATEAALYSGFFQATTRISADTHSSVQVRFDLGRREEAPRFYLITRYESPESSQTIEYVIIGEQAWQRVEGEAWIEIIEQEGVRGRIRRYLPQAEYVMDAVVQMDGEQAELRWQDSNRDLEATLWVDVTTAIPLEFHQEWSEGGNVTIVRYEGWNMPVEIEPPL